MIKLSLSVAKQCQQRDTHFNHALQGLIQHMLKRPTKLTHKGCAHNAPTAFDGMERAT